MDNHNKRTVTGLLSLALVLALLVPALGQRPVTVPAGTIISLRMDAYLSSDSSRAGDRFTATVFRTLMVDGRVAVPENAKVEGHIIGTTPAERGNKAGTIAIAFDRLAFPKGNSIPVEGTLTTLSEEGRRKIEQDISNEDRVDGGNRTRRAVIFIGSGAGGGAVIGAITTVPKGAAVGADVGALLGTIGVLLSGGEKAEVQPGTEFGMMVEHTFTVDTNIINVEDDRVYDDNDKGDPRQIVITSAESIRFAQTTLRDRGYYNGPSNGVMTNVTHHAIRQLQQDSNLPITGDIDFKTARILDITGEPGLEAGPIDIMNLRASRVAPGSIRISFEVQMKNNGWQILANRLVTGTTLHVYVRGVPPPYSAETGTDHHPFTRIYDNLPNITRVIIHGPHLDSTIDLPGSGAPIDKE